MDNRGPLPTATPAKRVMLKDPAEVARLQNKARAEFRDWKQTIKKMIDHESKCNFNKETGTWSFELPGTLIQVVVESLIRSRVSLERSPNKKAALHKAMEQLRGEFNLAVESVLAHETGAKKQADVDAEEEEAKNILEQYRAELVAQQQEDDGTSD